MTPKASRRLAESAIEDGIDVATFTSSSTVLNLAKLLDGDIRGLAEATVACIGPVTAQTASDLGIHVDIVASEHTIDGLVSALEERLSRGSGQK